MKINVACLTGILLLSANLPSITAQGVANRSASGAVHYKPGQTWTMTKESQLRFSRSTIFGGLVRWSTSRWTRFHGKSVGMSI